MSTKSTKIIVQQGNKKQNKNQQNGKRTPTQVIQIKTPPTRVAKQQNQKKTGFFQNVGSSIGKGVDWFAKVTGFGDYTINSNTISNGTSPPMFGRSGKRATIVRHREYLGDITGSPTFETQRLIPLNAASGALPWLTQVANAFEEFRIHGMVFEYKATCATAVASTNTALGAVIMATQYDAYDAPFTSKQEMENYEFSTSTTPFQDCLHPIECAPNEVVAPVLFTKSGAGFLGDRRLYDLGIMTIATVGMQAVATVGELWVTYEIELIKPKLSQAMGLYLDQAVGQTAQYAGSTAPSDAAPLGKPNTPDGEITNLTSFGLNSASPLTIKNNVTSVKVTSVASGSKVEVYDDRFAGRNVLIGWQVVGATPVVNVINDVNNLFECDHSNWFNWTAGQPASNLISSHGLTTAVAYAWVSLYVYALKATRHADEPTFSFVIPAGTYPGAAVEGRLLIQTISGVLDS
jgi:hypothetical protein